MLTVVHLQTQLCLCNVVLMSIHHDDIVWNAIAFLCCKRLVYYVKRWVTLSEKRVNLSTQYAIMLKACVVLSHNVLLC